MPYRRVGSTVMHKKGGRWKVKQRARSASNAAAAIRLLQGVEHGWKPTRKRRAKRR